LERVYHIYIIFAIEIIKFGQNDEYFFTILAFEVASEDFQV